MFNGAAWYEYLDEPMKVLVDEAYYLLDREGMEGEGLADYSFVVFPMAKAYEGFLKKYLFDLKLIDEKTRMGKHFRIGRSLNPSLPVKYRDDKWLFDDLKRVCGGLQKKEERQLPREMWRVWKEGRNKIFHYFPGGERLIDLREAREKVEGFQKVMELAVNCGALP